MEVGAPASFLRREIIPAGRNDPSFFDRLCWLRHRVGNAFLVVHVVALVDESGLGLLLCHQHRLSSSDAGAEFFDEGNCVIVRVEFMILDVFKKV